MLAVAAFAVSQDQETEIRGHLGTQPGEEPGTLICRAGDLDCDGADDFAVGTPFDRTDGNDAGGAVAVQGLRVHGLRVHIGNR